jgi:hypothetical protein
MRHWGVSARILAAALAGCTPVTAPPALAPPAIVEARPAALPVAQAGAPMTLAERIRQEGWLVRFWEQLTPAQRRRVTARLRQQGLARDGAEAAPAWDGLGLPEREALVFGAGPSRPRS